MFVRTNEKTDLMWYILPENWDMKMETTRSPWFSLCSEYIKELFEAEKKFLVFAHHQIMLDKLCETCENAKVE